MFDISTEQFDVLKNTIPYYRTYLIRFAEKMKQELGNDLWIKLALKDKKDNFIITDLRFKDEFDYLKKYNIIIIKIIDKNIKETDIDQLEYDYLIDNTNKDILELEDKVNKIIKEIMKNTGNTSIK